MTTQIMAGQEPVCVTGCGFSGLIEQLEGRSDLITVNPSLLNKAALHLSGKHDDFWSKAVRGQRAASKAAWRCKLFDLLEPLSGFDCCLCLMQDPDPRRCVSQIRVTAVLQLVDLLQPLTGLDCYLCLLQDPDACPGN